MTKLEVIEPIFLNALYLGIGMSVGGTGYFPDNCENESGLSKPWTGSDVRTFWWGGRPNYKQDGSVRFACNASGGTHARCCGACRRHADTPTMVR